MAAVFNKTNVPAPTGAVGYQVAKGRYTMAAVAAARFEDVPPQTDVWVTITPGSANNRPETIATRVAMCFGGTATDWRTALEQATAKEQHGSVAQRAIGMTLLYLAYHCEQHGELPDTFVEGIFVATETVTEDHVLEQLTAAVERKDTAAVLRLAAQLNQQRAEGEMASAKRKRGEQEQVVSAIAGIMDVMGDLRNGKKGKVDPAPEAPPKLSGTCSIDDFLAGGGVPAEFEAAVKALKYISFAKLAAALLGNRGAATAIDAEKPPLEESELPFAVWEVAAQAWEETMERFHPEQSAGIKEYMRYVRCLSRTFMGDAPRGYLRYDAQFRAHAAGLAHQGYTVKWSSPSEQLQMSIFAGCRASTCFLCGASDHDTQGHQAQVQWQGSESDVEETEGASDEELSDSDRDEAEDADEEDPSV